MRIPIRIIVYTYDELYLSIGQYYLVIMRTTIILKPDTRDKLRKYGRKEQTYDDIVNELLKNQESSNVAALDDPSTTRRM